MTLRTDTAVLVQLLKGQRRSGSHAEKLEAFYAPQAGRYDHFRERLLRGRAELMALLAAKPGERVVELGGGTGRNLDFMGERLGQLEWLELVDLCPSLLTVARGRAQNHPNVRVIEADASTHQPAAPADIVYCSYSLTMIPPWERTIDNAISMLKPGGRMGVVDFHLPETLSKPGKWFWRKWFGHDGVHLSGQHLPALKARLKTLHASEHFAAVPYLAGLKVPYYLFVGEKR